MTKQFGLFNGERAPSLEIRTKKLASKLEEAAAVAFARKVCPRVRTTKEPVIIAMIGLVGSGKTSVAKEFAEHIGGTVLGYDEICFELRNRRTGYEGANDILAVVSLGVIGLGGNAVIDSDFVDADDRKTLRTMSRRLGVRVTFVRTHTGLDTIVKRLLPPDLSLGGYDNVVPLRKQAEVGYEDVLVKLNKMLAHLTRHYAIKGSDYRRLVPRKLPCELLADIDTTNLVEWKRKVATCVAKLLK